MNTGNVKRVLLLCLMVSIVVMAEIYFYNKKITIEIPHLFYTKGPIKTVAYLISYFSSLVFIAAFIFFRSRLLFTITLILFSVSYYVATCYVLINGYGFGLAELQILSNEASKHATDAIDTYSQPFIHSAIILTIIIGLLLAARLVVYKNNIFIKNKKVLLIGLFSVVTSFGIAVKTTNTIAKFPTPTHFYNTLAYFKINSTYYGKREGLFSKPTHEIQYKNIIWIIDESVSAQFLSINGYPKDSTPFLRSISHKFKNLGAASSGANCSAESNIILMSGIQLDQLPDHDNYALKAPSIFQYAKNAKYTTHYISGQSYDDALQNNMTQFDLQSIDNFYQPEKSYEEKTIPEEDIIEKTNLALLNNDRNFIFIVKRGAHFQWEGKYPKNKSHFTPHLEADDVFDFENKNKAVNSYINLVKYRTDDFFRHFFEKTNTLNDEETLIIYTSDHGQSILENEKRGTQCDSTEPNLSQGLVPFLIFENKYAEKFENLGKNRFSHFEIFPTTLKLMGYSSPKGETIFSKKSDKRVFFSGDIFGRSVANFNEIPSE